MEFMLVLLSGPIAVGKTTVRNAVTKLHGFECIRSSAYLREVASDALHLSDRGDLQSLGDELDLMTDYKWVVDQVARPTIAGSPNRRRWLFDAVRKERQIAHFRNAYGSAVLHVHLVADEQILQDRYRSRALQVCDRTTYEEAIAHANEIAARSLLDRADMVIDTGRTTPEDAAGEIAALVAKIGVKNYKLPLGSQAGFRPNEGPFPGGVVNCRDTAARHHRGLRAYASRSGEPPVPYPSFEDIAEKYDIGDILLA